jgi:hypothetical protein
MALAALWEPWIETTIELFGVQRKSEFIEAALEKYRD